MRIKALFWTNEHDFDINKDLSDETRNLVTIHQAKSKEELLATLAHDTSINIVLTIININDIASLYQIQLIQKKYREMPIIAIFDSGSKQVLGDSASRLITMLHRHPIVSSTLEKSIQREHATLCGEEWSGNDDGGSEKVNRVRLTKRQVDVLKLLIHGKSNKQIARDLHLSEGTVKIHCMAIFKEIGVANRTQAALRAENLMHSGALSIKH